MMLCLDFKQLEADVLSQVEKDKKVSSAEISRVMRIRVEIIDKILSRLEGNGMVRKENGFWFPNQIDLLR